MRDESAATALEPALPPARVGLARAWSGQLRAGWREFVDTSQEMIRDLSRGWFFIPAAMAWTVVVTAVAYALDGAPAARTMAVAMAATVVVVTAYVAVAARWRTRSAARRAGAFVAMTFLAHVVQLAAAAHTPPRTTLLVLGLECMIAMLHAMSSPVGLRFAPWPAMPALAGLLVACTPMMAAQRVVVLLGAGAATAFAALTAAFAGRVHRGHVERGKLLAALEAQRTTEGALDAQRALGVLESVLGHAHDALSPLLAARATAAVLAVTLDDPEPEPDDLREQLRALEASLARVAAQLDASRESARGYLYKRFDEVALAECTRRVVAEQALRFPGVALDVAVAPGAANARVRVFDGAAALERVVTNLVANACEGDARGRARAVQVVVRVDGALLVRDDGPGFAALQVPPEGAPLTGSRDKPGGLGLGLFTVERLVRASGGEVRRRNRAAGGAEVEVRLPVV